MSPQPDGDPIIEFRNVSYQIRDAKGQTAKLLDGVSLTVFRGETLVLLGQERRGQDDRAQTHQSAPRSDRGGCARRGKINARVGPDRVAPPHRLRDSGNWFVSALHGREECRVDSAARAMARRSHREASATNCSRWWGSSRNNSASDTRISFPEGSASEWGWRARWQPIRQSC